MANYVLVKVRESVEQTAGGLYVPDAAKERATEGNVVAAGLGRVHPFTGVHLANPARAGTNVLYGKYDGTELMYDGIAHQLIHDDDILLVYDGAATDATVDNVQVVKDQVLIRLDHKVKQISITSSTSHPAYRTHHAAHIYTPMTRLLYTNTVSFCE